MLAQSSNLHRSAISTVNETRLTHLWSKLSPHTRSASIAGRSTLTCLLKTRKSRLQGLKCSFTLFLTKLIILVLLNRQILERGISQKIPMKKMRTLFKKYLDFEERFGDDETIQKVKTLAAQYVNAELKA